MTHESSFLPHTSKLHTVYDLFWQVSLIQPILPITFCYGKHDEAVRCYCVSTCLSLNDTLAHWHWPPASHTEDCSGLPWFFFFKSYTTDTMQHLHLCATEGVLLHMKYPRWRIFASRLTINIKNKRADMYFMYLILTILLIDARLFFWLIF